MAAQQPGSPGLGQGPASGPVLPVQPMPQSTQVWCWAAVTAMVVNYNGGSISDCQVVSDTLNLPCCGGGLPQCFTAGTLQAMQQEMMRFRGLRSYLANRPLTLPEIQGEIDNGRPVVIAYNGSFVGHVVVLYGYDAGGNLYIHDPFWGPAFVVPYAVALQYQSQQQTLVWGQTIYGIAPSNGAAPPPSPPDPYDPICSLAPSASSPAPALALAGLLSALGRRRVRPRRTVAAAGTRGQARLMPADG